MSAKYVQIKFTIPADLADYLKQLSFMPDNLDVSYLFKACAINRLIDRGLLDEFGYPNEIFRLPKLDFSSIPRSTFDLTNLHSCFDGGSVHDLKK